MKQLLGANLTNGSPIQNSSIHPKATYNKNKVKVKQLLVTDLPNRSGKTYSKKQKHLWKPITPFPLQVKH